MKTLCILISFVFLACNFQLYSSPVHKKEQQTYWRCKDCKSVNVSEFKCMKCGKPKPGVK